MGAKIEKMVTVGEWCGTWFCTNRHKWNHNTEGGYRNLIYNRIIPDIGDVRLDELSQERATEFYAKLSDQGFGSRTVWCVHLLLRRCMDEACREQLIEVNPVSACPTPQEEQRRKMPLRLGQVQRYLMTAEAQGVLPLVYVGLTSGLRQCELLELRWSDIRGRYIYRGRRMLVLNGKARPLLAQQQRTSKYVFPHPSTGAPYKLHKFYYLYRKLLSQARLPCVAFRDLQRQCVEVGIRQSENGSLTGR